MLVKQTKYPNIKLLQQVSALIFVLLGLFLVSSCSSLPATAATETSPPEPTQTEIPPTATPIPTPTVITLSPPFPVWIDPDLPVYFKDYLALSDQLTFNTSEESSLVQISLEGSQLAGSWHFLAVAPFYSQLEGIGIDGLTSCWSSGWNPTLPFSQILLSETTLEVLEMLWGATSQECALITDQHDLRNTLWSETGSIALIPFEHQEPSFKVLTLEGVNPLTSSADLSGYPLTIDLYFQINPGAQLTQLEKDSLSNFNPDYLSTVALTGVTALVRDTANIMETEGILYPAGDVQDLLSSADITHISNEVPFAEDCPIPDPSQVSLNFCSNDTYLDLLAAVGTDIVELSGDHFGDWGPEAMLHTIDLYQDLGWSIYGGGRNLAEGLAPVFLSDHGNNFAFIGCNGKGIDKYATATATNPGASQCDFDWMIGEITRLTSEGYLVIATMQHEEVDGFWPIALQLYDFRRLADAGAVIVSGSQAHHPQGFEFYENTFIHYGLGNLFFDQWYLANYNPKAHINKDKAFIDLHYFYQGSHIGTRLVPLQFIDNARPRPMTAEEANTFLAEVHQASRWYGDWIHLYSNGSFSHRIAQ